MPRTTRQARRGGSPGIHAPPERLSCHPGERLGAGVDDGTGGEHGGALGGEHIATYREIAAYWAMVGFGVFLFVAVFALPFLPRPEAFGRSGPERSSEAAGPAAGATARVELKSQQAPLGHVDRRAANLPDGEPRDR